MMGLIDNRQLKSRDDLAAEIEKDSCISIVAATFFILLGALATAWGSRWE